MDVGLVCDACNTFNPMGSKVCAQCEGGLSLDVPADDPTGEICPVCQNAVPAGRAKCERCGTPPPSRVAAAPAAKAARAQAGGGRKSRTMQFSALQSSRAKLTLIKGDGLDGVSFTLAGEEHLAGRRDDIPLVFPDDPFLSPVHANFLYRGGKLVVRDEGSVNGVYIRIRAPAKLAPGDRFLVGEQLLEVHSGHVDAGVYEAHEDGTYAYASPHVASSLLLVQRLRGGASGLRYRAPRNHVSLGREENDIDFPDDPYISGQHAEVAYAAGEITLTDLQSRNGTFLRIRDDYALEHGDYVFMGQQLLRVEIV